MKKKSTPENRLAALRETLKMSQVQFANKISISQGALSQLENGKTRLSLDTLKRVCDRLDINANWILKGEGQVFMLKHKGANKLEPDFLCFHRDEFIPFVKPDAFAGYIKNFGNKDYIKSIEAYKIPGFEQGNYRLFEISGDSMLPTLYPGEIVVTNCVTDLSTLKPGALGVVITKDRIVAKWIFNDPGKKGLLLLKSDNENYKSFTVKNDDVLEVWEIKSKITSEFLHMHAEQSNRMEHLEDRLDKLEGRLDSFSHKKKKS